VTILPSARKALSISKVSGGAHPDGGRSQGFQMVEVTIDSGGFIAGIGEHREIELEPAIAGQKVKGRGLNASPEVQDMIRGHMGNRVSVDKQ
jgi:hypothetical protein